MRVLCANYEFLGGNQYMKKKLFQRAVCLILAVTLLLGAFGLTISADGDKKYGSNRDTAATLEEMKTLVGVSTYEEYLLKYGDVQTEGLLPIPIKVTDVISGNGVLASESESCIEAFKENQSRWQGFTAEDWNSSVYLPASGQTTWSFQVPDGASGYYHIKIVYYSCITGESSSSAIERKLLIDGKAPFDEASYITFNKSWRYTNYTVTDPVATTEPDGSTTEYELRDDGYYKIYTVIKDGYKTVQTYKISQDINGNSMAATLEQFPEWGTYYCQDSSGYYEGNFRFYTATWLSASYSLVTVATD